ncbi:MAG: DUF4249 domain-containing protein [Chitinophagales bacterium]
MSCREPYTPPEIKTNNHYLVVSGFLNAGGTTTINLSRTRGLNDTIPNIPEYSAQVSVIGSFGDISQLTDMGAGTYQSNNLNLNVSETYQLQILTSNGNKYLSDTVSVLQTPPIDSVNWTQDSTGPSSKQGVNIYASTHDPSTPYGYYRWEYEESWKYRAAYESYYAYENGGLVARTPDQYIYYCWHNVPSTALVIGSSVQLSQNLIYEQPITFIPVGSERLGIKYSILVKQYSISKNAFEYWANLQQTTELTGSIFDPLPAQITGNIHNVSNPNEPVLGFISASSATEERIFISNAQVQHWGYIITGCEELILSPDQFAFYFGSGGYIPTGSKGIANVGATTPTCGDCRVSGGTTTVPAFWQ